ncbi:MAG TPA: T9SS type A sorting domain-containing protein [Saprospiraceae bacterium]|nr:T9SS type A sorting domain-containing protein [Saprospiraceae bacterium]
MKNFPLLIICFITHTLFAQNIDNDFNAGVFKEGRASLVTKVSGQKYIVDLNANSIVAGKVLSGLIRFNQDGSLDSTFQIDPTIGRTISKIKDDGLGNILISGNIYSHQGQYLAGILRLKENGDIDQSFEKYTSNNAQVIHFDLLPDRKIAIIERTLDSLNNTQYRTLLLNENGSIHADFTPFISQEQTELTVLNENKIIVGGSFLVNGESRNVIALDTLGNRIESYNPILMTVTGGSQAYGKGIVASKQQLVVLLTDFNTINVFDSTGQLVFVNQLAVNPPFSFLDQVYYITKLGEDGVLATGRNVYEINVENEPYILQVGTNVFTTPILNPSEDSDTSIISVGDVSFALGTKALGIVRLNYQDLLNVDTTFEAKLLTPGSVYGITAQQDGKLVVAGDFTIVGGEFTPKLIRLNADGSLDKTFAPDITKEITPYSVKTLPNGLLVVAATYISTGDFTKINGLAILTKEGKLIRNVAFPYFANGQGAIINLEVSEDKIYAGESTAYNINGKGGQNLVIYDHFGEKPLNLNNGYFTSIYRFNGYQLEKDNKLLLYGYQIGYEGYDTSCVVKVNADGSRNTTFNPSLPTDYWAKSAISINDGVLVAGFIQNSINFTTQAFITKLNPDGSKDNNFTGTISHTSLNSNVSNILEIYPNRYLLTGIFDTYNGFQVSNTALIDSFGNYIKEFPIGLSNVEAISCATVNKDNEMYIGGRFLADGKNASLIKLTDLQTNVNQTGLDNEMNAFPNPVVAGSNIYIDLGKEATNKKSKISVIEAATGKMIYSTVTNTNNAIINTQNIGTGMYLLQRSTDDLQSFIKIMVVK